MNDDIEFLCEKLAVTRLVELTDALTCNATEATPLISFLPEIKQLVHSTKNTAPAPIKKATKKKPQKKISKIASTQPWTKEELSSLAKAIKKFPAGGANRWETVANFVNNSLQLKNPRSKEECIAQYNSFAKLDAVDRAVKRKKDEKKETEWTEEQDKELQQGLAKFPSTLDKNERWTSIAKCVEGKTKKECVQRFKAIRDALKNGRGK